LNAGTAQDSAGSAGGRKVGGVCAATPVKGLAGGRADRVLLFVVGALMLFRLASLGSYPLMDTSEARYGEIARVMLETGNWVTPQETPGTPFWAKPPLSTWLSAGALQLFGVNEFALRLPALLCALGVLALCRSWSAALGPALATSSGAAPARSGPLAMALLSSTAGFFVAAGTVMTDPSLALCTTAMLVAFHQTAIGGLRSAWWRYGFFVAAGLGMLAKGPVIGLYVGVPIALWALWQRRIGATWKALPWLSGALLAAFICVPWYALAQQRTPGFLEYFLVGEHFMRFLKPGWGGDLYGTAHAEPLGTIWLYLAGALGLNLLLVLAAAYRAFRSRTRGAGPILPFGPDRRFLLLAALTPVVFFSFAGNIIWTYVLPALCPLAVLSADLLAPSFAASTSWRRLMLGVLLASGLSLALALLVWAPRHVGAHSSAALLVGWQARAHPGADALVYVGRRAPASLRFYSRGAARVVPDLAQALEGLDAGHERYLAMAPGAVAQARQVIGALVPAATVESIVANQDLALLRVRPVEVPARP
jgi:4-amino-4-deoxy-L-arabinose transferase-like glycosyltransferase